MYTRYPCKRRTVTLCMIASTMIGSIAVADGIETLGPPSIAISGGTDIVAAGTGLVTQPGVINIDVPVEASVEQVLLYWNGRGLVSDDTITVNAIAVTGVEIGHSTPGLPSNTGTSFAFRADITDLGLVVPGANVLTLENLDFSYLNDGAGVLIIYDDGTGPREIQLLDGHDFAGLSLGIQPPLDTTVPQTYTFEAMDVDRDLHMILFVADGEANRPDAIDYTVGAGATVTLIDEIVAGDGKEWDTFDLLIPIPAGETSVTVQVRSVKHEDQPNKTPDSVTWIVGAISIDIPEPPDDYEGCTPGYWKNHLGSWATYRPTDRINDSFGIDAKCNVTLLMALKAGGGGASALLRHAVAGLLNAADPEVNYAFTIDEVIDLVQEAFASGDYEETKDLLEAANEAGCPKGNDHECKDKFKKVIAHWKNKGDCKAKPWNNRRDDDKCNKHGCSHKQGHCGGRR